MLFERPCRLVGVEAGEGEGQLQEVHRLLHDGAAPCVQKLRLWIAASVGSDENDRDGEHRYVERIGRQAGGELASHQASELNAIEHRALELNVHQDCLEAVAQPLKRLTRLSVVGSAKESVTFCEAKLRNVPVVVLVLDVQHGWERLVCSHR